MQFHSQPQSLTNEPSLINKAWNPTIPAPTAKRWRERSLVHLSHHGCPETEAQNNKCCQITCICYTHQHTDVVWIYCTFFSYHNSYSLIFYSPHRLSWLASIHDSKKIKKFFTVDVSWWRPQHRGWSSDNEDFDEFIFGRNWITLESSLQPCSQIIPTTSFWKLLLPWWEYRWYFLWGEDMLRGKHSKCSGFGMRPRVKYI